MRRLVPLALALAASGCTAMRPQAMAPVPPAEVSAEVLTVPDGITPLTREQEEQVSGGAR